MDQNLGGFTGESRIEYFNRLIEKDRMDLFQLSPESGEMTALSEGLKLFGDAHADRLVYEAVIRDFILASCRENDPYLVLNQLRLHTVLKALNRSTSYQVHFPYRNTRKESHFLEVSFLQDKSTLFLLFRDLSAVSEPVSPESAPYSFTGKRYDNCNQNGPILKQIFTPKIRIGSQYVPLNSKAVIILLIFSVTVGVIFLIIISLH